MGSEPDWRPFKMRLSQQVWRRAEEMLRHGGRRRCQEHPEKTQELTKGVHPEFEHPTLEADPRGTLDATAARELFDVIRRQLFRGTLA
jgi:hypothetical protein